MAETEDPVLADRIEAALDTLYGPRESFRECLQPEAILHRICRTAEIVAPQESLEPWSIISRITGHGSGVSSAIYQVYRDDER